MKPEVVRAIDDLQTWRDQKPGSTVAFVPTMGALHEGHLELVRQARREADCVVVSIFVNPTQFGQGEDFERYPRDLGADIAALGDLADVVFAPDVDEVYPQDAPPHIEAGDVGATFEGAVRPGHFDGMLTVVNRLFDIVRPDVAVFGQKDAQQAFLVRRLAAQRGGPRIVIVPTVRESDGLARSSRNRYLSKEERRAASVIPRAVAAAQDAGVRGVRAARLAGTEAVAGEPLARLDYLELVDSATFCPVPDTFHGEATLVLAARFGATRLLDTETVTIP